MEAQVINRIKELAMENFTVERDGVLYSGKSLTPVRYEPVPECVSVATLSAFCAWVNAYSPVGFISVDDPTSVRFLSDYGRADKRLPSLIHAHVSRDLSDFPFGSFMSQEEFAIRFRSLFCPTADADYVLSYVARITNSSTAVTEDDGITQTCSVRTGVSGHLNAKEAVRPIVTLAPYRTFREIEQPQSEFLFRVRADRDGVPQVALFEADGGSWTIAACKSIAEKIKAELPDYLILS